MGRVVNLMISCGSGIATSVHVANIIKEYMRDHKIKVNINTCSVNELPNRISGVDLVLTTAKFEFDTGVPIFNGVPLLTGIGDEEVLESMRVKILELSER